MEQFRSRLAAAVLWLTVLGCGGDVTGPVTERAAAIAAVEAFVAANPSGWTTTGTATGIATRPSWTPACSDPASNGTVSLRLRTDRGDYEFSFACPVSERSTTEELEYQLVGVVPWNLAADIRAPNWRFQAWLPLSTVRTGIAFHRTSPTQLAVHISTFMSGIEGSSRRSDCVSPRATTIDGSCSLRRAHRVPLELHFTMPSDLSALR